MKINYFPFQTDMRSKIPFLEPPTPVTLKFELPLRVISKKNSKRWVWAQGRKYLLPSEAFQAFEEEALQIIRYMIFPKIKAPLKPWQHIPITASYQFFMKGNGWADLDNLIASVNDVMEKGGLIENDKHIRRYKEPVEIIGNQPAFSAKITLIGYL